MSSAKDALARARLQRLNEQSRERGKNRVLVVEDTRSIQALLCAYINNINGIEADGVSSLAEAEALLKENADDYFISVLDLNLPDAPDGEIVDFVHSFGVPVIVMTGTVDERVRQQMLEKNVLDYVVKRQATEIEHVTYIVGRIYENHETKVLVVDDSVSFRMYIVELLNNYQYQVFEAKDGIEALEVLEENPDIALILTDYNMPRMNGQELVQTVRKDHRREDLAIIGMSDVARSDLSALLLKSGANDFLSKPFQVEEFYCRITQNTNMVGYVRKIKEGATKDFRNYSASVNSVLTAHVQNSGRSPLNARPIATAALTPCFRQVDR
ncbi:MAG: response regulator, partial [Candidatus Polarisedimenticolaceae bacterium]|nr:response regulator [Candidatus Polarisedimenticolaceae bacterium]